MSAITSHYNLAIVIQEQRRGNAVRDLKQDVTRLNQRLDKNGQVMGQATSKTQQFTDKAKRAGERIRRVLVPALLLASTAAIAFGREAFTSFAQFDKGMQEVFTLLPERTQQLEDSLTAGIKSVGQQFGYLTEETIPALYQALSAGIPDDNAVAAVGLAAKAAKAGASDLESTMRIGMAVVNAYGGEVYDLGEAYDLIFQLIDKGVPRMDDWANSLQDVISIASEARTPFEDIVAALAVMTRQGDSAAEASELLGFILMQLQIEGTTAAQVFMEATGQTYREWINTGNGLVDGLERLNQYAIETGGHLDSMIGGSSNFYRDQQAARGTMELTGIHMQELIDLSIAVKKEAEGSMEAAYGTAADNAQQSLDEIAAKWETIKLNIGEAIYEQDLFMTALAGVEIFSSYVSGDLGDQILVDLDEIIEKAEGSREKLLEVAEAFTSVDTRLLEGRGTETFFDETMVEGEKRIAAALAKTYTAYEDFRFDMQRLDIMPDFYEKYDYGVERAIKGAIGLGAGRAKINAEIDAEWKKFYYENYTLTQEQQAMDEANLTVLNKIRAEGIDITEEMTLMSGVLVKLGLDRYFTAEAYQEAQIKIAREEARLLLITEDRHSSWKKLNIDVEKHGWLIHWIAVETQQMSMEAETYIGVVSEQSINLMTAYDNLAAASGEWRSVIADNSGEINKIMVELGDDLSNDEKSAMQEILRTAEEGGAEWLGAWRRLQTDLTETERNELIARMANLQEASGTYRDVWTGDKAAAKDAQEEITKALTAIDEAYSNMAKNMVLNRMEADDRLKGTIEQEKNAIEFALARGDIDQDTYEYQLQQLEMARQLDMVTDEMMSSYIADGKLSREEALKLAHAQELVRKATGLTDDELKSYLDRALGPEGGYPKVAGVIRDDLGKAADDQKKKQEELAKKPIVPKVEMDKSRFDKMYDKLVEQIEDAKGPHVIQFIPSFSFPFQTSKPEEEHATGTSGWRTVPGGFPDDSYFIGLTSREKYQVVTPGQAAKGLGEGGSIDNSITNITMINNSRAAAAYSRAYMETQYERRLRRFAGD